MANIWTINVDDCISVLLTGLVTSADTGNEDLVIVSRTALVDFCEGSPKNLKQICEALLRNLKQNQGQDRVIVPTLEVVAYLFHIGQLQRCPEINLRQLCLLAQKAAYKTGNVRKLEACIKVYGAIAAVDVIDGPPHISPELATKRSEGILEAKRRLGALLIHPWPRARCLVVDELWSLMPDADTKQAKLLAVDWSKAEKSQIKTIVGQLGLE